MELINFTIYMTHGLFNNRLIEKIKEGAIFFFVSLLFLEQTEKKHLALYIAVGEPKANETTLMSALSYQSLSEKTVCKI